MVIFFAFLVINLKVMHYACSSLCTVVLFYQILASAFDTVNPENPGFANITINVQRNVNSPRFVQSDYSTNILETTAVGTTVVMLTATDDDQVCLN